MVSTFSLTRDHISRSARQNAEERDTRRQGSRQTNRKQSRSLSVNNLTINATLLYFARRRRYRVRRAADRRRHANGRAVADDRFSGGDCFFLSFSFHFAFFLPPSLLLLRLLLQGSRSRGGLVVVVVVDPDRKNARVLTKGTPSCLLPPSLTPLSLYLSLALALSFSLRGCETTSRWFWCLVPRPAIYLTNRPSTAVISSFLGFPPIYSPPPLISPVPVFLPWSLPPDSYRYPAIRSTSSSRYRHSGSFGDFFSASRKGSRQRGDRGDR